MPNTDKLYTPDAAEIRKKFLRDLELGFSDAGIDTPAIDEASEYYLLATAVGNMGAIAYAQFRGVLKDSSELTATGKALDDIRIAVGLPEVPASPGSGRVTPTISASGLIPFPDGLQFTVDKTGLRGKVQGAQKISSGGSLKVIMIDEGSSSNADPFEKITFTSPPNNVATKAEVNSDGITGGTDKENDEQKRQRILSRRRDLPAGGNYGYAIDLAQNATSTVQKGYCYPAILGPSYMKVVVTKAMQLLDNRPKEFTRELGESSLQIVQDAVLGSYPESVEISVQSAQDEYFDCSLLVTLPSPKNGGWVDTGAIFPALEAGDSNKVTVSSVTSTNQITVSAVQSTSPVVGQHISWWSPDKRAFVTAGITAVGGSAGAWVLTLDRPLSIEEAQVQAGDFISPGALNIQEYGKAFLAQMNLLGPGENTDSEDRLPRASRRPFVSEEYFSDLNAQQLKAISNAFPEILDYSFGYQSLTSPTVPADESDPPNVLVPLNFGIYSL